MSHVFIGEVEIKYMQCSNNPCLFLCAAAILVIFPLTEKSYAVDEALPVEGIVYESKNPSQSFAVIDGNIYKKGEQYQGYQVMEVKQDRIFVKDAAGKISEQRIKGGNHPAAVPAPAAPVQPLPLMQQAASLPAAPPASASSLDPLEQLKKMFGGLDLGALKNYASELSVMVDLRNLHSQATAIAMEEGGTKKLNLDRLIKEGGVDPSYKDGKNGYRFRVEATDQGAQVYADPIQGADKSSHFMIDEKGKIHVEQGAAATEKSSLSKAPADMQGLAAKAAQSSDSQTDDSEQDKEQLGHLLKMPST